MIVMTLLGEAIVIFFGACFGCIFGVYVSDFLFYRKSREVALRDIDKRVQDLLDKTKIDEVSHVEDKYREDEAPSIGRNLNMRV